MTERLSGAVIQVEANLDGQSRTASLELRKDFERESESTHEFVVGPVGEIGARVLNLVTNSDSRLRQPYVIDAGGGRVAYDLRATLSETPHNGSYLQMGDTGDPDHLTATDATGADARTQADVAQRWLSQSTIDSVNPATLHIGHYHDGTYTDSGEAGLFGSPLDVYVANTRVIMSSEESSTVDFNVTLVPVATLANALDAAAQLG
ncbi:hypothetical protein [Halobellus sp. H-GB7]|uniref:hypothetical protein n=1 Tax=Halobellus sp. H-GB7 TaxID=3069756 RepID=UPI0027B78119|nr:hypothetical protein [Halobellus sp. H-GB7]MDQ2053229.1 hypothetical protein [Halobellus sp. H-GB7]